MKELPSYTIPERNFSADVGPAAIAAGLTLFSYVSAAVAELLWFMMEQRVYAERSATQGVLQAVDKQAVRKNIKKLLTNLRRGFGLYKINKAAQHW